MTITAAPVPAAEAVGTERVIRFRVQVPPGKLIHYSLENLCSGLGVDDPTRIAVETDGLRSGIVTIYPSNPLAEVRAVTRDDLVMDRIGRIRVGVYHNNRLVKKHLFDPSTGSAQRFVLFGTTGAGKSRALQLDLIAEKINGIVSWLADLKNGQSVPEAAGNVEWRGTSQELAILMLRAGVAVAHERMERYSAIGRTAFRLGDPDPLLHLTIEEANRLLGPGAPYRDEATYLIGELGKTGRSVGVGVRIAAQAGHLEELGGSDTLRAMLREGEVVLLRWSSSTMQQLVTDTLLPSGAQLMPIPKFLHPQVLGSLGDVDDDDDDDDDGPRTQGMAYLLTGPRPTAMMRHFRVGSIAPLPGLDPEILDLYGDGEPPRLEAASYAAAGPAYAARNDPAALATLVEAFRNEQQQDTARKPARSGGSGPTASSGPRRAGERIESALATAESAATAEEILAAVNADGDRELTIGTIRNTLRELKEDGAVNLEGQDNKNRSLYTLAR